MSEFKNARSLYSHKYKYHPKSLKSTTNGELNRKKEYGHGQNRMPNNSYSTSTNSKIDNNSHKNMKQYNKPLPKFTRRLPKLFRIVGDILDDVKELKEAVSDIRINSISPVSSRSLSPAGSMEELKDTGSMEELKDTGKQNFSLNSEMIGFGKKDENRLKELGDDIDRLFLLVTELEGSKIREMNDYGIESMEKAFDNTLEMIELFQNNMYRDIKFKIKQLRNAALVTLKMLKKSNELGRDNKQLLQKLSNASIFEAKDLLKNNIESLKSIFALLPDEEEFVQAAKEIKHSEFGDEDESDSSESESSEIESSENENEVEERESDTEMKEAEYGDKDETESIENESIEDENDERESVSGSSRNENDESERDTDQTQDEE